MSEPIAIPVFAGFQYNEGWRSWEEVIPSALDEPRVVKTVRLEDAQAIVDTLRAQLAAVTAERDAARADGPRLMFVCRDFDGYVDVKLDKYDYAMQCAAEGGRVEPTPEDELNGVRRMIDAAIDAAQKEKQQDAKPTDWRQAFNAEREKFQRETLRTSEQATLLRKWMERHIREHYPGPWSRGCEVCALVGETEALLAKPINAAAIDTAVNNTQGTTDEQL